ncbi:MAG: NADH-quinone oxidoreductase subunit K, partial [Nitrospirae bacterium GWC1_57_7]
SRRNVFIVLMSIELMLNAANINMVAFSHYLQNLTGQIFVIFIITVAAAEAAVALAIIILLARNRGSVHVDEFNLMKG